MKKPNLVIWPTLTLGRSRVLSNRRQRVFRWAPFANQQPVATGKAATLLSGTRASCPLSLGERVRVRASVSLTFLLRSCIQRSHRSRVSRQGVGSTFLKRVENDISDELFLPSQLPVPEAKLLDTHRSEKFRSFLIGRLLGRMPMMATIKLNGKAGFHAIEVEVVNSARMISTELVGTEPAVTQPTPHELFSPSRLLPKSTSAFGVWHGGRLRRCKRFEKNGSTLTLTLTLSPRRGGIIRRLSACRSVVDCSRVAAQISNSKTGGVA